MMFSLKYVQLYLCLSLLYLNVALVRLLNFSQFMEKMENWDFCFLAWVGCTFKITLSFTLRITISFIFRQIANLSDMYLRGGANL